MPASASSLMISVSCQNRLLIKLAINRGESLDVQTNLSPQHLAEYRKVLSNGLDKFWKLVGTGLKVTDFQAASEAMRHLHAVGRQLNFELFGANRYEVEDFLRRACPTWQQSGSVGYRSPMIEIITQAEHVIPFEFLPLFDTTPPSSIRSMDELTRTASQFLGFSTIIHRVLISPYWRNSAGINSSDILENIPRLGIRFFHHAGLDGAKKEREFFQRANWLDLKGPWPDQLLDQNQFISELATQLWHASSAAIGGVQKPIDQIHHFSCHCDTNKANSVDYSLYLAHKSKWLFSNHLVRRAGIGALEQEFGGFPQRNVKEIFPLVFLNACGASKLDPNGVTSFPSLFLKIGNRGVIGTETRVPDLYAAAFSESFYLHLIRGNSLGEAIYRARWDLLKRYKNPLGILYTVYANPDLHVRKPLPEATSLSS